MPSLRLWLACLDGRVEVLAVLPPIAQKARICQVMDRLLTSGGTRRDLREDDDFVRSFLREAAAKHRDDHLLVVTFLEHEEKLRKYLERIHANTTVVHYGALRGLGAYGDYGAGIVIGRPMPNEARLSLLDVSAFGLDALSKSLALPELEWTLAHYSLDKTLWQVRCQRYGEPIEETAGAQARRSTSSGGEGTCPVMSYGCPREVTPRGDFVGH